MLLRKIFLPFCFPLKILFAQTESSDTINKSFSLGLRAHYSYIFIHVKDVIPGEDYFPRGAEMNFNWHLIGNKAWEQCNCYPGTGLIISFFDFDNRKILGYGYTAAYYMEPFFSAGKKINISFQNINSSVTVRILNQLGEEMIVSQSLSSAIVSLNVASLPPAIYLLEVVGAMGNILTRFVRQ